MGYNKLCYSIETRYNFTGIRAIFPAPYTPKPPSAPEQSSIFEGLGTVGNKSKRSNNPLPLVVDGSEGDYDDGE